MYRSSFTIGIVKNLENSAGKLHQYRDVIVFRKLPFFVVKLKDVARRCNSSGSMSVFKKLRFRDGLVWTVSLAVPIELRFQILLV